MANERFDVVVAGGGVIGWSIAWHLLRRNQTLSVCVFDPTPHFRSSDRGAGGVRSFFSSPINVRLSLLSIQKYLRFRAEVGWEIDFNPRGYLVYSRHAQGEKQLRQVAENCALEGASTQMLSIAETSAMVPFLNLGNVMSACLTASDGTLNGPSVVKGYENAARSLGAHYYPERVVRLDSKSLSTTQREVAAENVILATGHWSRLFGLPVRAEKHHLARIQAEIPAQTPMIVDADTGFHFRPDGAHVIIGGGSRRPEDSEDFSKIPEVSPRWWPSVQPSLQEVWPESVNFAPPDIWSGYYAVTPDGHPLVGFRDGVFVATGFGGHGVMHAPAIGQIVAECILDGNSQSIDLSALDPNRAQNESDLGETMVL